MLKVAQDSNNDLRKIQIALKAAGFYSGNIEGKPDTEISLALEKALKAIKSKFPEDTSATSISISVDKDGKVSGDISKFEMFVAKLMESKTTKEENPLFKVFSTTPFGAFKVDSDESLKSAINKVRADLDKFASKFSNERHSAILLAFDEAIKNQNADDIKKAFGVIANELSKNEEAIKKVEGMFINKLKLGLKIS